MKLLWGSRREHVGVRVREPAWSCRSWRGTCWAVRVMEEGMFFSLCASLSDEVSQCVRRSGEDSGVSLGKAVLHLTPVPSAACGHALRGSPERTLSGSIQIPGRIMCLTPCLLFLGVTKESHMLTAECTRLSRSLPASRLGPSRLSLHHWPHEPHRFSVSVLY